MGARPKQHVSDGERRRRPSVSQVSRGVRGVAGKEPTWCLARDADSR